MSCRTNRRKSYEPDWFTPGDSAVLTVELQQAIALEERTHFAVRVGNGIVGAGLVTRILA
jgi:translation elongation factor EF-Tu-like GTPase